MFWSPVLIIISLFRVTSSFSIKNWDNPSQNEYNLEISVQEQIVDRFNHSYVKFLQNQISSFSFGIENIDGENTTLFESVSPACSNHSIEVIEQVGHNFENILNAETWVLQMIDAWGKLPEGILSGHIQALGDYDECLGIRWNDIDEEIFQGKYCYNYLIPNLSTGKEDLTEASSFSMENSKSIRSNSQKAGSINDIIAIMQQSLVTDYPLFPSFGSCFPSSCTDTDVKQLLTNALKLSKFNETFIPLTMYCETGNRQFAPGDYAMLSVLSILGMLVLLGTAMDLYYMRTKGKISNRILIRIIISFSVYTNTKKWWNTENKSSDGLGCLHGIKFFSTSWVVMGHTFFMYTNQPLWNTLEMYKIYEKSALLMVVLNANIVVDTFFTVGGFLVSYSVLKTLDKTKGKLNIPLMYLSRYIRLTPAYALILGFCTTLITHLSSGPSWYIMDILANTCRKNWWKNLLYINSVIKYYPKEDPMDLPCHGQSWYLSTDMMFFLISPFLIYPLWRKQKVGITIMAIVTLVSVVIPCVITYTGNFKPIPIPFADTNGGSFARDAYMAPWMRGTPYAVGIWLGFLLYKKPKCFKIPKPIIFIGWMTATGTALTVVFGIHHYFDPNYDIPKVEGAFFAGVHRLVWGLSIAWLIFACSRGYGGYVNKFLCWKGFIPLSRLGYCVFLVSLQLQFLFHLRYRQSINYDFYSAINLFFAHMVTSYFVGFICSMTMEAPFMQLEKIIFGSRKTVKSEKQNALANKS